MPKGNILFIIKHNLILKKIPLAQTPLYALANEMALQYFLKPSKGGASITSPESPFYKVWATAKK